VWHLKLSAIQVILFKLSKESLEVRKFVLEYPFYIFDIGNFIKSCSIWKKLCHPKKKLSWPNPFRRKSYQQTISFHIKSGRWIPSYHSEFEYRKVKTLIQNFLNWIEVFLKWSWSAWFFSWFPPSSLWMHWSARKKALSSMWWVEFWIRTQWFSNFFDSRGTA
jgi:hypothetical protein